MAIEEISVFERIIQEIIVNEEIEVDGVAKTVYDAQFEPKTNQILLEFTDGDKRTVTLFQTIKFVKDVERPRIKPLKRIE